MAEDKADKALKEAYLAKVYYSGDEPEDSGWTWFDFGDVDKGCEPWLFKWYRANDGLCHQYVDGGTAYRSIIHDIERLVDIAFVNDRQRQATKSAIDKILIDALIHDQANEGDRVL